MYFIAAILSLAQWWIFLQYHESDFHEIGLATANFFHGETHWRAFQNRLLGPGLVVLVQRVLHYWRHIDEYDRALRAYYCFITIATNLWFIHLAISIRRSLALGFACMLGVIAFQIAMWNHWYYPWDPVEMNLFSTLLLMDLKRDRSLLFFLILFFIWVFTKETAIFVAIWLILTRFATPPRGPSHLRWTFDWAVGFSAALMVLICLIITTTLRNRLYVHSVLPGVDAAPAIHGNFLTIWPNFKHLVGALWRLVHFHFKGDYGSLYAMAVGCLIMYAVWRLQTISPVPVRAWSVLLFAFTYFGSVIFSALIVESRVYLPLAPMILAFYFVLSGDRLEENKYVD